MLKLFYYYNGFLLVLCFIILLNLCQLRSEETDLDPFFWIMTGASLYYSVLQACVVFVRRREIQTKKIIFATLAMFELLPVGVIIFQVLF
jgi:hypothetical protein